MNNYTFGNYICELREKQGLSQKELGEKLGVTNKAVSKWENGGAYPASELMLPLARALGVSIEELYSAVANEKRGKSKTRHLLDALSRNAAIIILVSAVLPLLMWCSYLASGDDPDKTFVLILSFVVPVMLYGFMRLLFFIFRKNPMCSPRIYDLFSVLFLCVIAPLFLVTMVCNYVSCFPNGFTPSAGAVVGLVAGVLHANKKRI